MSMAVGLAVLDVIKDEGLVNHAKVTGEFFLEELNFLMKKHVCIGDVRSVVFILGVIQRREWVCQMRTLLLIFTCKRPKCADRGGRGIKNGQIFRISFMDGPLCSFT